MMTAIILGLLALSVLALLAALAFLYRWIVRRRVFPQLPKLWKADKSRFVISLCLFVLFAAGFAGAGFVNISGTQVADPTTPPAERPTGPSFENAGVASQPGAEPGAAGQGGVTYQPQPSEGGEQYQAQLNPASQDGEPENSGEEAAADETGQLLENLTGAPPDLSSDSAGAQGDEQAAEEEEQPGQEGEQEPDIRPDLAARAETPPAPRALPQSQPQQPLASPAAPLVEPEPAPKPAPEPAPTNVRVKPKPAAKLKPAPKPKAPAKAVSKPAPKPAPAAKPKPAAKAKPEPPAVSSPKPAPPKKAAPAQAGKRFTVCVESFKNRQRAQEQNAKLKEMGFISRVVSINIKGMGIYHRICVGTFDNRDQALTLAKRLQQRGISKSPFVTGLP